ncbi:phage tail protein [Pedobacter vanadiisoli]|uniref:Phage tail protein n=1 Tax=Pedobacter vanadiisoli TaxID=1761975 RepID=A0ABW5MNP9_9SPHI
MPATPFVGEIFMFAGNFAMNGTALCNGQLLPISQNTALFSLLGTTYGGDGRATFALPNLQGTVPLGQGQSTTGSMYDLGQTAGSATVTLLQTEIPSHNHTLQVAMGTGTTPLTATAVGSLPATTTTNLYSDTAGANFMTPLNVNLNTTTEITGSGFPHNNMQPYLAVTFVVAMQGVFPARS